MFTSSFIENSKPIVLTPQNKPSDVTSSNIMVRAIQLQIIIKLILLIQY